ncbi:uncharacterized protein LOC111330583 [Stylophora pistillata]|uniref:Uncharacterized protein n=1 Tax=Stylophora pistillata TaxID=50429 RepID=A0A2B4S7B0_STYPI|nr:uncharacterized protein LOC111330583 [Stylophora pistillata]PFX25266.1 hypothetical protein AWC38_SpisGene10098 [Stylophora pistillata]
MMTSYGIDSPQTDSDGSRFYRTKTLCGLLEQYLSETSLSSFTEISSCRQNMEAKELVSILNEEVEEHKTSLAPPPLLHRPTKRSLEHSQMNVTSPDSKHPRLESCSAYFDHQTGRVLKEPFDVREQMFERTRSLENSLKPSLPPPPLLKQTLVNTNGQKSQITPHIPQHREIFHHTTAKWSTILDSDQCENKIALLQNATISNRVLDHRLQIKETDDRRYSSSAGNAGKHKASTAQPVPRQITTDDHSSCGGYAFDHMAMPKIVAVHSVSKSTRDEDEWKRNKAFISKVKAAQDRSFHCQTPVEVHGQTREKLQEIPPVKTRLVTSQDQQSSLHDHHWQKGTSHSSSAGLKDRSTDVSFERFALYHLLSKFQGNVEQVKRALKENLLKEWLEYSQGNTDPNKQMLSGVNLSELRKLYDAWCTLKKSQRENETQSGCLANILNSQNFEQHRVKISSELSVRKNHEVCKSNSRLSPSTQLSNAICPGYLSPRNISKSVQAGHRTSLNPSPVPLNPQRIRNNVTGENTRSMPMQHSPMLIQEKISSLSQSSILNPTIGSKSTFSPVGASFRGHDKTAECIKLEQVQPKTNQVFSYDDKELAFDGPNKDVADSIVDHISRVSRTSQRTDVEKEIKSGSNLSIRASVLWHFPERTSRPAQKESFSFVNSPTTTAFCNSFVSSSSRAESDQSGPPAAEKAIHSDSRSTEISSGHETKASYLWRFKGGRLISDNMPSLYTGKTITEVEFAGPTVDARMRNEVKEPEVVVKRERTPEKQSCHRDSSWKSIPQASPLVSSAVEQEHKKVCGAAASGRRCYCVVGPKCRPQMEKTSTDPLQSMQNMINRAAESSPRCLAPQIYPQRPDIAVKSEKNIVATNSAQVYQQPSTIVRISANAHDHQQSRASVSVPNNGQPGRQSTANFHFAISSQEKQQSYNTVNVTSTANRNLQPTVSLHVSPAAKSSSLNVSSNEQVNRPSSAGLRGLGNAKEKSSFNVHLSCGEQKNQRPNSTNTHAQYNEPIKHQLIANQQEFPRDEEVNSLLIPRSQIKQQTQNDAGMNTLRPVREANQQVSRQSNPIRNPENTIQTAQLTDGSHIEQENQQSNIQHTVSKTPAKTMVRIAPKLETGAAREKEKPKKAEKVNDKQCSFLTSHPPKKQYTSLQQLANKVIETRQRFEMESIPWKKKILKSLEAVLMKRLRKIERETGEQANLDSEKISETEKNKIGHQKEK